MWQLYTRIRKVKSLSTVVILLRYLLGFAFIPSGYKKLIGIRFTQISTDSDIGLFFEGLYQSGFYWQFLGFTQMFAALLLMTQRFATIGNLIFFGIVANICVITWAMDFHGTWLITSGMLFASACLLLWDLNKIYFLVKPDNFKTTFEWDNLPSYNIYWISAGLVIYILSVVLSYSSIQ